MVMFDDVCVIFHRFLLVEMPSMAGCVCWL